MLKVSNNIKLYKRDIPENLNLGNRIAVDGEFMGLNVRRDPLCLIQLSSGSSDAHIIQLDRNSYEAPNLVKLLNDEKITKTCFPLFIKNVTFDIKISSECFPLFIKKVICGVEVAKRCRPTKTPNDQKTNRPKYQNAKRPKDQKTIRPKGQKTKMPKDQKLTGFRTLVQALAECARRASLINLASFGTI